MSRKKEVYQRLNKNGMDKKLKNQKGIYRIGILLLSFLSFSGFAIIFSIYKKVPITESLPMALLGTFLILFAYLGKGLIK